MNSAAVPSSSRRTAGPALVSPILIATSALILIIVIWTVATERIRSEREQAVAAEIVKNDNLAIAHEERASRSIEVVDTLLRFVRADHLGKGSVLGLSQRLASLGAEARFIIALSVVGPRGDVLATNVDMPPETNFSDRAYFRHHAENTSDELLIGQPIIGRFTGQQVISLTRRIELPGGGFGGVVFISMDPAFFSRLYERSNNGINGALALIGLDGITRVRRNGDKVSYGEDIRSSQLFKELPRSSAGHYVAKAASDGVLRAVSYRKLENFPLIVVVGSSLDEVLAGVGARGRATWITATIATLLILTVAALLMVVVTRRTRTLAAIEDSEQRYRQLFERSLDAILRTNPDGTVTAANAAACQIFDASERVLCGMASEQLFDVGDTRFRALMDELEQAGQVRGSLTMKRPDGTRFEAEISANLYAGADEQQGASLVVRDLTARMAADAERVQLEAQLRQAQKLESVGTLAGGIAHDFNNILASILGNVALATADLPNDSPAQHSLQQIRQASHRARDLVHQILAFSRRNLQARAVHDVRTVLEESHALLRAAIPAGIDIALRLDPMPMHVSVDMGQIQQVLMNLGVNAWQAISGAHGRIEMSASLVTTDVGGRDGPPTLAAGPYVQLTVRDNGSGMDEAVLARIFEPFFTTKPVGKGSGLGLAVVHGIVQAHQGAITVRSRVGEGTSFQVWLPLVAGQAIADAPDVPRVLQRQGHGERIAFVDDDDLMRSMAHRLLVLKGYAPECFESADAVLAALRADPKAVDLVITDFNMPGASGLELAQALAALVPGLPVIISSGHIDDTLRDAARMAGVRAVLHKETLLDTLGAELRRVLPAVPATPGQA